MDFPKDSNGRDTLDAKTELVMFEDYTEDDDSEEVLLIDDERSVDDELLIDGELCMDGEPLIERW